MATTTTGFEIEEICFKRLPRLPAGLRNWYHPSQVTGNPKDIRPEDIRDVLPADLNAADYAGPYRCPDNSRRRIPGVLYILTGMFSSVATLMAGGDAVLLNRGFLAGGMALVLLGLYHLQAGWTLAVGENEALAAAARSVGFPVGHASAQLSWRGLRSRPTWRILLYSDEPGRESPKRRGLVLVDGVNGEVVQGFVEESPEDWPSLRC